MAELILSIFKEMLGDPNDGPESGIYQGVRPVSGEVYPDATLDNLSEISNHFTNDSLDKSIYIDFTSSLFFLIHL